MVSSHEIGLSSEGCGEGYICTATALYAWLDRLDTVPGSNYPCHPDNSGVTLSDKLSTKWPCYTRAANKNFMNNSTATMCASDEDCQLSDGTVVEGSCKCGLRANNGYGVCQPDFSADVFAGYWDECDSDSEITDSVEGYYWHLYMNYYPVVATYDVPCAATLLEVADFKLFRTEYLGAQSLTAVVALWLGVAN